MTQKHIEALKASIARHKAVHAAMKEESRRLAEELAAEREQLKREEQ